MTLLDAVLPEPEPRPGHRLRGRLDAVLVGRGPGFRTTAVPRASLDHEGIAGDAHRGFVRRSGGREPWYPRGTPIRSGRQLSIVSAEELAEVAARLALDALDPATIGANLVVSGVPRLSWLPAGTRIVLEDGAAVVVEAVNHPCRLAGRALAEAHGRDELELAFPREAVRRRGVVASVERAGEAAARTALSVRVPEQWIWTA